MMTTTMTTKKKMMTTTMKRKRRHGFSSIRHNMHTSWGSCSPRAAASLCRLKTDPWISKLQRPQRIHWVRIK
uniref:Uncharacterized protein n=1 Tax=Triticum urartu TaxID=4572 RepID=A0A8R7U107_TRIUA